MSSWFQQREYQSFCFCSTGDLSTSRGRIGATGWWPSWNVFFPRRRPGKRCWGWSPTRAIPPTPRAGCPIHGQNIKIRLEIKEFYILRIEIVGLSFFQLGMCTFLDCLVNSNITATSTTNLHIPRLLYKIKPILLLIKYNSAKNKASEKKTTL